MAYIYDLTDTWSAAGTVFNAIKLNVTNTASAAASKLVTLQIGGTEHFSVTKAGVGYFSGNLGIGNTSPNALLELSKASGAADLRLSVNGTLYANIYASASDTNIIGVQNLPLIFGTNNTERMRITGGGNVGIGTSSPGKKLDLVGQFRVSGSAASGYALLEYGTSATATNNWHVGSEGDGSFRWYNGTLGAGTERMRIDSSGNVGIGTSSPNTKLNVLLGDVMPAASGNMNTGVIFMSGAGAQALNFGASSTNNVCWINAAFANNSGVAASNLVFMIGATERARIDSSGNLLVGSTSTSYAYANTSMRWVGGSGGLMLSQNSTSNLNQMVFFNPNGAVGSINTSGTGTIFSTSSDARLKHDIDDAPEASSLIDALQVRSFKWNADNSQQRYGFIAQELVIVAPEAVSQPEDPEEMMGVDYSKLVPMLIKEVQSLRARVAQLEGN